MSFLLFDFQNVPHLRHVPAVEDGVPDSAKSLGVVQDQQEHLPFDLVGLVHTVSNYPSLNDWTPSPSIHDLTIQSMGLASLIGVRVALKLRFRSWVQRGCLLLWDL